MENLKVRIVSPDGEVFKGEALVLSSKNSAGKFDILPSHANFVTLIQNDPIKITRPDKSVATFNYALAVMHVNKNVVNIYTEIPENVGQGIIQS